MSLAIDCKNLSKVYRVGFLSKRVHALQGIDFQVRPGEVFGLIGPNGAGKSTTIKILLNLVFGEGEASIFGEDVKNAKARQRLGYVPESPVPYEYLTGLEYLGLQAKLAGLSGAELTADVRRVIDRVDMGRHAPLQIRRYSKGMVQRVMLAGALLGKPRLLVLDEPTSGLDPMGRRLVRDIIVEERKAGVSVLFCTHIIPDVESLCDRVALIIGGKIRREGTVAELVSGGVQTHEVVVEGAQLDQIRSAVGARATSIDTVGGRTQLTVVDAELQPVLGQLIQGGHRVMRVQPVRFSLEDTFLEALKAAPARVGGELE